MKESVLLKLLEDTIKKDGLAGLRNLAENKEIQKAVRRAVKNRRKEIAKLK